jgi:hypothetical protein
MIVKLKLFSDVSISDKEEREKEEVVKLQSTPRIQGSARHIHQFC